MKFNLVKTSSRRTNTELLDTIIDMWIEDFCKDHDIILRYTVKKFFTDFNAGLPSVIEWARHQGWAVSIWSLPDPIHSSGPVAYGLDFDDNCTLFMEARLKYS